MGKLEGGLFGRLSGRIGNQVYYQLRGKTVVRKIGRNENPASHKQLHVRQKMKVLGDFFKPIKAYLKLGFAEAVAGTAMFPYNAAVKYNLEGGIQGEYPDLVIDYENILVSKGELLLPLNPVVEKTLEGLRFSWEVDALDYQARYDSAMLLICFPEHHDAIYFLNAAHRLAGTVLIPLSAEELAREMRIYISFISEGKNQVSDSVYLPLFT